MKRAIREWSVDQLSKLRDRITFPDYQREPKLWTQENKQLLIDSIIRDIDVPKLYFNKTAEKTFEVIDGQQRLWAVWEFVDDSYALTKGRYKGVFSELPRQVQEQIASYKFQVVELSDIDDSDLRLLFLRLQFGLLLITGEKLRAAKGAMKKFTYEEMPSHDWIQKLKMRERRFAKETLCAQICINVFSRKRTGKFARTRYEDLRYFFEEFASPTGQDKALFVDLTTQLMSLLDRLDKGFGDITTKLNNRSFILSLVLLANDLDSKKPLKISDVRLLADFASYLWRKLKEEIAAGIKRENETLFEFEAQLSSAPGEKYQIERRHSTMIKCYQQYVKNGKLPGE